MKNVSHRPLTIMKTDTPLGENHYTPLGARDPAAASRGKGQL